MLQNDHRIPLISFSPSGRLFGPERHVGRVLSLIRDGAATDAEECAEDQQASQWISVTVTDQYTPHFNTYFGTEMPMLPDRSVFIGWNRPEQRRVISAEQLSMTFCTSRRLADSFSSSSASTW